jgi:hypothetical protein
MATILSDIEAVRSLRKSLRNPTLPIEMLSSIELIHSCIKSGTDTNGWKRIDWRGGVSHSKGAYTHSKSSFVGGGGGGGGRHSSGSDKPSHSAFSSRPRGPAPKPTATADTPASIPLVAPTTAAGGAGATATVTATAAPEVIHSRHPPQKYVSKFKKTSDKIEDTILNTILLAVSSFLGHWLVLI